MKLQIDPKVDIAFKRVFGSEDHAVLPVNLINAVIMPPPGKRVTELDIVQAQSEKESPLDKLAIGDIRAYDQGKRQFHLEMQWNVPEYFPKRGHSSLIPTGRQARMT